MLKTQSMHEYSASHYQDYTLGSFIKSIRQNLNLTQEELAQHLDISPSHLSRIESDLQRIGLDEWFKLCEYAKLPFDAYRFLKKVEY